MSDQSSVVSDSAKIISQEPIEHNINSLPTINEIIPSELSKFIGQNDGQITPNMLEDLRKLTMGTQGKQIIDEMRRKGVDLDLMKSQLIERQKLLKKPSANPRKCVLITGNRQLKMRTVEPGLESLTATKIIQSGTPVEFSCSRLAIGPLSGKTIKVWCDPNRKGSNKRLAKILGFPVAGEALIIMYDGDLTEQDFISAEKLLN